MAEQTEESTTLPLRVQVGDIITRGSGDYSTTVLIAWTNRSYTPGALDAQGTDQEHPAARATPVDAICLVAPVGEGQFAGSAMRPEFLRYLGWIRPTDEEIDAACAADDDFAAREGHTWEVTVPGYRHATHDWWDTFRFPTTFESTPT